MSIVDLPAQAQTDLNAILNAWAAGQIITQSNLNTTLANLGAHWLSHAVWQTSNIAAGIITLERQARFTYASIRNEGGVPSDDLDQINSIPQTPFTDGDYVILRQGLPGQVTRITNTSNIAPQNGNFDIPDLQTAIVLLMVRGSWVQIAPTKLEDILRVYLDYADIPQPPAPAEVDAFRSLLNVIYRDLLTETRATAVITMTAASGSSGSIIVIVDDGTGPIAIGEASYTSATTVAAVLADLETSIDTGGTGFNASVAAPTITVQAPIGTGAGGNSISFAVQILGGISATSPSSFSGGIDATEADTDLDAVNNMTEGKFLLLRNRMQDNSVTLSGGGNTGAKFDRELKGGEMALLVGGTSGTAFPLFGCSETRRIVNVDSSMSPYTVKAIDRIIQVDTTLGPVVLDLTPVAQFPKGIDLVAIKIAGAFTLTLDADGTELIDGSPTLVTTRSMIYTDGIQWFSLI